VSSVNNSKSTEKVEDYCPTNYLSNLGKTQEQIDDLRETRENIYYNNYKDIVDWINNGETHEIFDTYRGSAAMMLTLLCLVFITFFVILVLCCGLCNKKGSNKLFVFIAWIIFIGFVGLFIAMIVYLGKAQKKIE